MTQRSRAIAVLVLGFVLLGMPGAALGVAWPSMSEQLTRDLGDLGMLTVMTGIGYGIVSFSIGGLTRRLSAGRLLVAAGVTAAAALLVYATADVWWWLLIAALPLGLAGGAVDAIGNAYVAVRAGPRAMGAIHAAFGFGAMIAPLMMTALVALDLSWRIGFAVLAAAEGLLAIAFLTVRATIRMPAEGRAERPKRFGRRRLLGMSVWVFFIYAGVEGSTGLWAFTLLTEGHGMSDTVAGLAVAAHWGALFVSRLMIGIMGDRLPLDATNTVCVLAITAGIAMLWWYPSPWVAVAGLVIAGFANGPVFPFEMLLNRPRFGQEFTPWAVGYQLSAATAAIAVIPAGIGVAVNLSGPLVIGGILAALAVVTVISVEVLRVMSTGDRTTSVASS